MQHPLIVTLLFTDVQGSTPLASLGDTFVEVVEGHRTILTGAAGARRGSGYPTGGDGCVFIFGSAGDAVAAAVEAQRHLLAGRIDIEEHDGGARLGEQLGRRFPDPGGRPGDRGDLAGQPAPLTHRAARSARACRGRAPRRH
jgi:class 3 adenylate cyclase